MADKSKTRMNLSAIKKVDPYAKDIVDSSSHVAFYTFNADQNEWEKTDVEGAFFIYNRNAEPFHSIFINNRLNTTSFVEPITGQLELQSQPPFLLYRNERSRIRGFWFYNSEECDRISNLVNSLLQNNSENVNNGEIFSAASIFKQPNVNIFNMLSKAQQEYNESKCQQNTTPRNVLQFFASAKPTNAEVSFNRVLPLSVDQLEKQQRALSPNENNAIAKDNKLTAAANNSYSNNCFVIANKFSPTHLNQMPMKTMDIPAQQFSFIGEPKTPNQTINALPTYTTDDAEKCLRKLLVSEPPSQLEIDIKPALMPPTMFDAPILKSEESIPSTIQTQPLYQQQQPLNPNQLVQAFSYLIQNDNDFVRKLHEAYLKTFSNSFYDTSATYH